MLVRRLRKYYLPATFAFFSVVFLLTYYQAYFVNFEEHIDAFEYDLHQEQTRLTQELNSFCSDLEDLDLNEVWIKANDDKGINYHVYRNDSLIYWNTNQLPIIRFAEIHYPTEGLVHLQNGWYFSEMRDLGDFTVCASFLIRKDYSYENKELVNDFDPTFELPFGANITTEPEEGHKIKGSKGEYLFSIIPDEEQAISRSQSVMLMLSFIALTLSFGMILLRRIRKSPMPFKWGLLLLFVIARWMSIEYTWFEFLGHSEGFDPALYGANKWFPNFFEYLMNVVLFLYVLYELKELCVWMRSKSWAKFPMLILFLGSILIWPLILLLAKGLIEDSSIPLIIDQLFSLNVYSLLAMASLGVAFYFYFLLVRAIVKGLKEQSWNPTQLAVITFALGMSFFLWDIYTGTHILATSLFPLAFYGIMLYLSWRDGGRKLAPGLVLLTLFSLVMAMNMGSYGARKEKGERELYASQLATEQNIVTEAEYATLSPKLKQDNVLQKFISSPQSVSVSAFEEGMERRLFNGYWERYEMSFSLFDGDHKPLIEFRKDPEVLFKELQGIVENSGEPSDIDSNIFFIPDYSGQYSYIIRQPLVGKDSATAILFCTLKSKKIPEEIGFPRLLISSEANVLESLESYSIVKYHDNRLIAKYGNFNYPSSPGAMLDNDFQSKEFFDYGEFNHYAVSKSDKDVVILSRRNSTYVDVITSFSYLFTFFGLLLLPLLFRLNRNEKTRRTLSLAMKIQLVLISLVFLSLLAFGWGSGIFVRNQYNQYTNDVIREKLNSVQTEVRAKLGSFDTLSIDENGNYMQYILQKFAKVFFTDINLYDNDGYLLATSRPKVFNVGLLSEQMNPEAFTQMCFNQKSEYVHNESIGDLNYSSAYLPFYNNEGVQMGFINLQHFGQQSEFENQIQKFLVAIVNVFILLLAISIVLAIFISTWLTSPLRILQESFAAVRFGKHNEQISYDKEDEIGALVREYNQKLAELDFAAQQLARSERESAWREMAKQVAHEIKNPLTPMKLSVQQLLRTYNPDDPKSGEKLQRVANSIIEQIDGLTKIANEFSSFAKMPNPSEEKIDLVRLIKGVREVFSSETNTSITLRVESGSYQIMADKDQFVRVFNNLIKNAIQAIPMDQKGKILINVERQDNGVIVQVTDNGVGIEKSKRSNIFVPYFTTKSTGTGLGLAMVKQIVENHKGSIHFESIVGEGTTFEIKLPLA